MTCWMGVDVGGARKRFDVALVDERGLVGLRSRQSGACGIRWTPPRADLGGNPYYAWIIEGLRLYEALEEQPVEVIECFPTASWTRWHGPRGARSRSDWTRAALFALDLEDVPART